MKRKDNLPLNIIERMNARVSMIVSVVILAIICVVFNRLDYNMIQKPAQEAKEVVEEETAAAAAEAETALPVSTSTARIVAVGDNFIEGNALNSGVTGSGGYSFDRLYEQIRPDIQAADLAIVTQETPLTDSESMVSSSFPYASPLAVGDALIAAGFDVIALATENMTAAGDGVLGKTMEYFSAHPEVKAVGMHAGASQPTFETVMAGDISIGVVDFVMPIQGVTVGATSTFSPDVFGTAQVSAAVSAARAATDCVVCVAHWGYYQEPMPNEYQKEWAQYLIGQGVDVIIGSYAQTLSPYVWVYDTGTGRKGLVYYGLGNFISAGDSQRKLLGGMATFTVSKTVSGDSKTVTVENSDLIPLVMHYDYANNAFSVYKLSSYTDTLGSSHSASLFYDVDMSVSSLTRNADEILSMIPGPAAGTNLLDTVLDSDGNMYDAYGNYVEDTASVTASEYYENGGAPGMTTATGGRRQSEDWGDSYDDEYYEEDYDSDYDYDEEYYDEEYSDDEYYEEEYSDDEYYEEY